MKSFAYGKTIHKNALKHCDFCSKAMKSFAYGKTIHKNALKHCDFCSLIRRFLCQNHRLWSDLSP